MTDLDVTAIVVAIISLISSAAVAIITYHLTSNNESKLEKLRDELDYKSQARKRLYLEYEPLSFQLAELSELAMRRIKGLAREAREGHLELVEHWYTNDTGDHMVNAIYRLLAPLAVFRLMQRKLTIVDFTLDQSADLRYKLAKVLYFSFTHDSRLASKCSLTSNYLNPKTEEEKRNPAVYERQGIYHQSRIDTMADALIFGDSDKTWRIRTFQEFEDNYRNSRQTAFDPIMSLLHEFHPKIKPVLWLILLLQLHIYQALIELHKDKVMFGSDSPYNAIPKDIFSKMEKHPEDIDWRQPSEKQTTKDEVVWDEPLKAVKSYLQDNWAHLLQD